MGLNVSFFTYGVSSAYKTHTIQGRGGDVGIVQNIAEKMFNVLEDSRYSNKISRFDVRIRYMEIVDEEVYDLLQPGGGHGFGKGNLRFHEWEGAMV